MANVVFASTVIPHLGITFRSIFALFCYWFDFLALLISLKDLGQNVLVG
jgi:hypothetical protein